MRIRVGRSARRHRIGKAHILAALQAADEPARMGDDAYLYIGADDRGVELEMVLVPDDTGRADFTVIHAMPTYYRE